MVIFGVIGAILAGVLYPCVAIVMGEIVDTFDPSNTPEDMLEDMKWLLTIFLIIGILSWITTYMYFAFSQHVAENISYNLRAIYLEKLLQ